MIATLAENSSCFLKALSVYVDRQGLPAQETCDLCYEVAGDGADVGFYEQLTGVDDEDAF